MADMTPESIELLQSARELIAAPQHWTKGSYRRYRRTGQRAYCVLGAIHESLWADDYTPERYAAIKTPAIASLYMAIPKDFMGGLPEYNDARRTTHADILALFDRAIELARKG